MVVHLKIRRKGKLQRFRLQDNEYLIGATYLGSKIHQIKIKGEDQNYRTVTQADCDRFSKKGRLASAINNMKETI